MGLLAAGHARAQTQFESGTRTTQSPSTDSPPRLEPVLIFFPPNPPPLGRAIARASSPTGRAAPPPELASYVNELFYPALGTRLATKTLTPKLRTRLEQYRDAKITLQSELRAELDRVRSTESATRISELETFARRQSAAVTQLEATAEELRRDLIVSDHTWGAIRQWRLGDGDRRGFSPFEIGQVMRGSAFYQTGLLPAQRRLLREISIELYSAGENTTAATAQQPYLFFPPEPARVLLPDDVPPEVATRLASYQSKKSALKKQLYDAVYDYDGQKFAFLRSNPLKALAERQAAGLAELETLAEEIRRGLAAFTEPAAIAERTPLPPVLHQRVGALMLDFSTLQKETALKAEAILAGGRDLPMQATYRFDGDGMKFVVVPSGPGRGGRGSRGPTPPATPEALARIDGIRTEFARVAEDYGQRVAVLINEREAIRVEIGRTLGQAKATIIDNALFAAMRVVTAKETEGLYRDYRVAVFQPGLSPGQRRLLFDHVIEELALPLPRGELQPIYRANSW